MHRPLPRFLLATCTSLAACAGPGRAPALSTWLSEAPEAEPARLWLVDDRVVRAIVPVGPGAVPQAARERVEQAAPGGTMEFHGREWGPFGSGFRVDKRYDDRQVALRRTVLVDGDGRLLDFGQAVPLPQVPRAVLDAVLGFGRDVQACWLFAEPGRDPRWECTVVDRIGRTHVVTTDLDGRVRSTSREVGARLRI